MIDDDNMTCDDAPSTTYVVDGTRGHVMMTIVTHCWATTIFWVRNGPNFKDLNSILRKLGPNCSTVETVQIPVRARPNSPSDISSGTRTTRCCSAAVTYNCKAVVYRALSASRPCSRQLTIKRAAVDFAAARRRRAGGGEEDGKLENQVKSGDGGTGKRMWF